MATGAFIRRNTVNYPVQLEPEVSKIQVIQVNIEPHKIVNPVKPSEEWIMLPWKPFVLVQIVPVVRCLGYVLRISTD